MRIRGVIYVIREHTPCRVGIHCQASKRIVKFGGGKLPGLCRYCYLIIGYAR